jgi:hypothetical protein
MYLINMFTFFLSKVALLILSTISSAQANALAAQYLANADHTNSINCDRLRYASNSELLYSVKKNGFTT